MQVTEALHELGIAHIAGSQIGTDTTRGISGGERKRLAIAAELIIDPSILILDEVSRPQTYLEPANCSIANKWVG